MPSKSRRAVRAGYVEDRVSIRQLFESGQTREPSENALRDRANRGILVFVESVGNTHYYDRLLSVIRVNAARACKRPGVKWSDIANCLAKSDLAKRELVPMLSDGHSEDQLVEALKTDLLKLLGAA